MSSPRPERAMTAGGVRLLAIGIVMIVAGLALALVLDGTAAGIGVAVMALGAVPFFGGLGLWVSARVSNRSRAGKPYA